VTIDHLFHRTGDSEQDARRRERIAWVHYLQMQRSLADTPPHRADAARARVATAKADFARAWRALDGATR
jgi:hypothetical protein